MARNTPECSKRPSSKAAASEGARRTLRYVERLSEARTPLEDFFSILLEQCLEFVNGQAGIANDSTHGDGIDGIMTRDRDDSLAVTHHKMLALADHPVAGFLKRTFRIKVIDSGKLWQRYTATSISRTSCPLISSSTAAKYSRIASWIL